MPRPATDWRTAWPLLGGMVMLVVAAALLLGRVRAACDGDVAFALDDAYIHLAMAEHVAQDGVWGLTPHGFTSSSSSPLWTLALAGLFALTGPGIAGALVLNLLGAVAIALVTWRLGERGGLRPWQTALLIGAVLLAAPVLPVVFTGMEHTLHVAACLWLLERLLADGGDGRRPHPAWLGAAALVAAGLRYETLFLAAPAGAMLLAERRWRAAVWLAAGALLPGVLYAVFSVSHGGHVLPDTLLLKGVAPRWQSAREIAESLGLRAVHVALMGPIMYLTFLAAAVVLAWANLRPTRDAGDGRVRRLELVWLGALALHFTLAQGGWFYRYEAYLCATGVAVACLGLARAGRPATLWSRHAPAGAWLPAVLLAGCVIVPLAARGVTALAEVPTAAQNIHQQQVQMGRFLRDRAAPGLPVAANDVGAINYLADLRCLDLVGLASPEILAARREGRQSRALVAALARERDVRWAVLYADLMARVIPEDWRPVERWTIPDVLVCASPTVTWFACQPGEERPLREALAAFREMLPAAVTVEVLP